MLLDLNQIPLVVPGDIDGVMRQILVDTLQPQIEHVGRAGIVFAGQSAIGPPPPQAVRNQPLSGASEVGVDDHRIRRDKFATNPDSLRLPTRELDGLHV